jgi:hypothetical protein
MTTDQSNYIASINNVLMNYNNKYCNRAAIGSRTDREWSDIQYIWANVLRDILEEYFSTDYTVDSNFFTAYTAEKVMMDLCAITNSSYFLKLANDTPPTTLTPAYTDSLFNSQGNFETTDNITGTYKLPFNNKFDFTNFPNDPSQWDLNG